MTKTFNALVAAARAPGTELEQARTMIFSCSVGGEEIRKLCDAAHNDLGDNPEQHLRKAHAKALDIVHGLAPLIGLEP